jgi:hypothetical protein
MSVLDDFHAVLYDALKPVLPGRVDPYPPPAGRIVAPKIWIDDDEGFPGTIGQSTAITLVRFPVVLVYDGAVHAQVAGLRELKSAILDAIGSAPGFEVDGWRPAPILGLPLDTSIRSSVVTATATITARTFCPPPAPDAVTVPPTPVEV